MSINHVPLAIAVGLLSVIRVESALSQNVPTSAEVASRRLVDEVPFAPLAKSSTLAIRWPNGALYEGDVNLHAPLWSKTSALRTFGEQEAKYQGSDCAPTPFVAIGKFFRRQGKRDSTKRLLGGVFRRHDGSNVAAGCTAIFTPHFVIRQLKGGSAPVRSPTFNPKIEFNWYELENTTISNKSRSRAEDSTIRNAALTALHLGFGHYSNGQSGCFFNTQTKLSDTTDICVGPSGGYHDLNTVAGSFSTDYFEAGLTVADVQFSEAGVEMSRFGLTMMARWNPAFLANFGGMNNELARLHGRWSSRARLEQRQLFNPIYRMILLGAMEGECASRKYLPCRGLAEVQLSFPGLYGFGIFARYALGADYYNMGFGQSMRNGAPVFKSSFRTPIIGVSFDHSRLMTITKRAATDPLSQLGPVP